MCRQLQVSTRQTLTFVAVASRIAVRISSVPTKVREAIRIIEDDGWVQAKATSGTSHRQYKHPVKSGRVTISGKMSDDLAPGTFNSVLKQAGLK
jgi:predicted RNA binding protein YcfA (HicA-like mRNA interferase family)